MTEVFVFNTPVADLAPLAHLAQLRVLRLDNTPVADLAPLAHLAVLSDLSVAGTAVRDLTPLHGLPRLQRIDLSDTAVAPEQLAALRAAIPAVEILGEP